MSLQIIPSLNEWLQTYSNISTRKKAELSYNTWKKFSPDDVTLQMLKQDSSNLKYITLQRLINYLIEEGISGVTIRTYWNFIRNWWWWNGIKTDPQEIKSFVKFPKTLKEIREPMTAETIRKICNASLPHYSAFFLVLATSGVRPNELIQTKKENINFNSNPVRIYLPPTITKKAQGREAFITQQAATSLKENLDEVLKITDSAYRLHFWKIRKQLGLEQRYSNNKNYLAQVYAMRSFFFTQATLKHGSDYAHAMTGHGQYLPNYMRIPLETREKMYLELEPNLRI